MSERTLLTVLGLLRRNRQDANQLVTYEYELAGQAQEAPLAPAALLRLLDRDKRPTKILAFCTPKAKAETYPELQKALGEPPYDIETESVAIPSQDPRGDVGAFLDAFARSVPRTGILTIEITHGFRHYALLMLLGAFYVDALRPELEIDNIYYALLQSPPARSPYIDLKQLLDFFKWIYAANTFRDTGSALPMVELIRKASRPAEAEDMTRNLRRLSRAVADALPLELGLEAADLLDRFPRHLYRLAQKTLPSAALSLELRDTVKQTLTPYALPDAEAKKPDTALDEAELQRQAQFIKRLYQEYGSHAAAFGLMREWVVSWAVWRLERNPGSWLDWEKTRKQAERRLGLLGQLAQLQDEGQIPTQLAPAQYDLGTFWRDHLGPTRNSAHHHGMDAGHAFKADRQQQAADAWRYWSETLQFLPAISLRITAGTYRRLIVSPLGNTPGVLFSAVRTLPATTDEQDLCLVISSAQAQGGMDEALDRAAFAGRRVLLSFQNPFSGLEERRSLLEKATRYVLKAEATHVNLTGGTSLMGLLSEEIANVARRYQRLAARFILIDERPYPQQLAHPFVEGRKIVVEPASERP